MSKYKKLNPIKNKIKEQINDLEIKNDTLASKDIVFDEKINSKPNIDDLNIDFDIEDTEDLEKDDNLENLINQTQKNTTNAKSKLLDKFDEIDKKTEVVEPQTPTKKRSVRKNR